MTHFDDQGKSLIRELTTMNPLTILLRQLEQDYNIHIDTLIRDIKRYLPSVNVENVQKAFYFAAEAHNGQARNDGTPYITHPVEAARILVSLHADEDTLIAAFLHDVPEDTSRTLEDIEKVFGKSVAFLVDGVTKLSKVHYQHDMAQRQIESLKKLFIHTAQDPRIILIKLADRLHNMRTLHFVTKEEKRVRIARETFEIFVPIANLLGIEELKSELEELCFYYLFPDEWANLEDRMKRSKEKKDHLTEQTITMVEEEFKKHAIIATVYARKKNLYSIYKKIIYQERRLDDFDNTIWLRILVEDKEHCYQVLGILHSLFKPKSGRFKDYIAVPKINGYQSLHTTVFGPNGINTEFQIRSNAMHLEAEYGIAAKYFRRQNEQKNVLEVEDKRSDWAAKILTMQEEEKVDQEFIEDLKLDIFRDRIFVFTPTGDAIDLPQDATCIDFAYSIHTQVGHHALKADVNGILLPMNTTLHNGDTVGIIVSDLPKGPNRSWLAFVKTNFAKHRIRDYFKKTSREEKLKGGKALLQKGLDRAGKGLIKDIPQKKIKAFAATHPGCNGLDDILIAIGEGVLHPVDLINFIGKKHSPLPLSKKVKHNLPTTVIIKVVGKNVPEQLEKILQVLAQASLQPFKIKTFSSFLKKDFVCKLSLQINDFAQLSTLFESLEQIEGVKTVERLFWQRKLLFFWGCSLTFALWAAHPFILYYLTTQVSNEWDPLYASILNYVGISMLFIMLSLLKNLTQRSFPELRETTGFWGITFVLSMFALVTLFAEIYFFKLYFSWMLILGMALLVVGLLVAGYSHYREKLKGKS